MSRPYMTYTQNRDDQEFADDVNFIEVSPDSNEQAPLDLSMLEHRHGLPGMTKVSLAQVRYFLVRHNYDRNKAANALDMSPGAIAGRAWRHGLPVRDTRTGILYKMVNGEKVAVPEEDARPF